MGKRAEAAARNRRWWGESLPITGDYGQYSFRPWDDESYSPGRSYRAADARFWADQAAGELRAKRNAFIFWFTRREWRRSTSTPSGDDAGDGEFHDSEDHGGT